MKPFLTSTLLAFLFAWPLPAVEKGDVVIVKADAPLKFSGKVVGQIKAGEVAKVKSVRGAWADIGEAKSGWVRVDNLLGPDVALSRVNELLEGTEDQGEKAKLLVSRGRIRFMKGELDDAESDFNDALDDAPKDGWSRYYLGKIRLRYNDFRAAKDFFDQAIDRDAKQAEFFRARALACHELGDLDDTVSNLVSAAEFGEQDPYVLNVVAWSLATHPDSSKRDGAKAVRFATKACELTNYKNFALVDTLAAAYAESGDFTNAVKYQEQAVDLMNQPTVKAEAQQRLNDYRLNKSYQETPRLDPLLRQRLAE